MYIGGEMKLFDNIANIVRDDMKENITQGSRVSIAAACFSMYAYQELKTQLESVEELRFIFTSPTFVTDRESKQKREFYIPKQDREKSLYGTEFEIKLRNEMTQKAIARECADWIRRRATFKSNTTGENMAGFMTIEGEDEDYTYMPFNGFTTVDIGCERGNNAYNMVNRFENPITKEYLKTFDAIWSDKEKLQDVVDFDTDELVRKSITSLDKDLRVKKLYFRVDSGSLNTITSKEDLLSGKNFVKEDIKTYGNEVKIAVNSNVKYDLVGKLVDETGLTRKAIIQILTGINKNVFEQFKDNPEDFIIKAAELINQQKATAIIEHITYHVLDEEYSMDIFTEPTIKGKLDVNAMKTKQHLYDHLLYDSKVEKEFAECLDTSNDIAVYVKLPDGFYISTPVGKYNPDWAIAFKEGHIKHIYFIAETKGSMKSLQLKLIEESKLHCAREHFKAISGGNVVYDVVDSYQALLDKVMK